MLVRILIDARELRTSTGRYIERLLHYLQEIDKKNTYLVLLKPGDLEAWSPSSKRFIKIACRYKEFTFGEQIGMLLQIHRLKPDLVHFGMVQQPIFYFGRVVTTMHDLITTRFRNPTKNWLVFTFKQQIYKWVNIIVARKSKIIITPTEFIKDDVAKFARINSRKIVVTYESADPITDKAEPVEELIDKQFIMYVGRPTPHKNLDRLIEAFTLLKPTHPNLQLVLAGKKDQLYRRYRREVKKRNLEGVVFTGFVSDGTLRWLYENAGAYVFPSLSEGFGLPGLEAMVQSCPVVSSNASCLPEVYGEAASYFNPFDEQEMADKIAEVLDSPKLRQRLIEAGVQQAKKYSWRRMAEQTLSIYQQVSDK